MTPELPAPLRVAIDRLLEGVTRKGLADRAGRISETYRKGGTSASVVTDADEAMAYVLARLPATYAAGIRVLDEVADLVPAFVPTSLLDAGAGPGGASWAALETWSGLKDVTLLDSNRSFLDMATALAAEGPDALKSARQVRADLTGQEAFPTADLVVASYALAEIREDKQAALIAALWSACTGVLVLLEPGTPAGYSRLMAARADLTGQGAHILAPCPHGLACPLVEPDWCHFRQRLPRSRDHRLAKGAELAFEDEKFSYLVVVRDHLAPASAEARVLAPPQAAKPGITLKLCTPDGQVETRQVPRRDKPAHALARRLDWGDTTGLA